MDCVCWRQCKNRGAFLLRIPGEGLYRHFRMAEHSPLANPSHFRAPLAAHRTDGGSAYRGVGDYATKEEYDSGEDGWGDKSDGNLGNGSGASGMSSAGDDESLIEGLDRTSGAAEDGRDWQKGTQRRRKCGGRKARARRQGRHG